MKTVYKLEAQDCNGAKECEKFLIGFFSSTEICEKTEMRYKELPGFSNKLCRFIRIAYPFDVSSIPAIVYYVSEASYSDEVDDAEIGLFLNEKEATVAMRDYIEEHYHGIVPDCTEVCIDKYVIDKGYWSEGFSEVAE